MTNELTIAKIEEIASELEKAGLVRITEHRHCDDHTVALTAPSKRVKTYLGTYLNPFSFYSREGHPLLWSDEWAYECPEVTVHPVYRHNGTSEDVSVGVSVTESAKPEYVKAVREGSPFNYLEEKDPIFASVSGGQTRLAKLKNTAGKKAVANAVAKAVAACGAFVPLDHSAYEKDPKDYHPDTKSEYYGWQKAERDAGRPA